MKLSPELSRQMAAMLRQHIRDKYRTGTVAARVWNVKPAFVSKVLNGHSAPTNAMLEDAGIALVAIYLPANIKSRRYRP